MTAQRSSLDLYSTSQTNECFSSLGLCASEVFCAYHAPYFAYQKEGKFYGVVQGCCNHWDCPRCGILRAKMEYGRIVVGIEELAKTHLILFLTLTCRGKEVTVAQAYAGYLEWTNRFITSARSKAKRENQDWYYAQVTEAQKRGHPHSHILTTFDPGDLANGFKDNWKSVNGRIENVPKSCLRSEWIHTQCVRSGLGDQYDVSLVETPAAASRYVAKYMFKPSMMDAQYPKGWKRVRYSQTFPQLPDRKTDAFVLLSRNDWQKLARLASVIATDSDLTKQECLHFLQGHDILIG